jgi:hypothetical protein
MPVLLYSVVSAANAPECSQAGVAGVSVTRVEVAELACYVSEGSSTDEWPGAALREAALHFHRVLMDLFRRTTIIPFRFPTILEDARAVAAHLESRREDYNTLLARFEAKVQMDITVAFSGNRDTPASGAGFLRQRQIQRQLLDSAENELKGKTRGIALEWVRRELREGVRIFALVDRNQIAHFKNSLVPAELPPSLCARVTGPWPVSGFVSLSVQG